MRKADVEVSMTARITTCLRQRHARKGERNFTLVGVAVLAYSEMIVNKYCYTIMELYVVYCFHLSIELMSIIVRPILPYTKPVIGVNCALMPNEHAA